jgi:hypothetical protein
MKNLTKRCGLYLRTEQIDRLKIVAQETGTSASELVRRATDLWLLLRGARIEHAAAWGDDGYVPVEGKVTVGDSEPHL